MNPVEIEFKYNAEAIPLSSFVELCASRQPENLILASGWDHFYENTKNPDAFCRLRVGPDSNQLTFKRKLADKNNFIRTEHNIDLERHVSLEQIANLVSEFGYKPNTKLFKNCFIYKFDKHIFVYYIVYDAGMKEVGRYVEIEMSEEHPWESEAQAMEALIELEKVFKPLGISPQSRIKRSLWEMYKK